MAPEISPASADQLARTVLRERLGLRPKERVTIECYPSALPWAAGFVREARRANAFPLVHYEDETSYWTAVEGGKARLVGTLAEHEKALLDETDVYIFFWGPEDLGRRERLSGPAREATVAFNPEWYKRAQKAGLRGARMAIARVTEENARQFGVPLGAWRSRLLAASLGDLGRRAASARRLARALGRAGEVRLTHPNGTDLTLRLARRRVTQTTGELPPRDSRGMFGMMINVPDGSVYTSVDESCGEGTLVANRRTTANGPRLEGGRWTFSGGRLTSYRFKDGGSRFRELYRGASGAKDRVSFLEIGLDPLEGGLPFLEENEAGAVSVGLGSNQAVGGKNKSSLFTSLTVAGADLSIDGSPVVRRGRIV
jgi:leucyl aminopeptidase (aminopeptidase T)